ncbi:MAG: UDP-N-acetylglucosamine--N-acetylmuramyl-(pentapeptide) pyrophosphoryl-undecaprenol N-acetylglucosamine transferase [Chloroflexi bacterium OHK40]
MLSGGGTGGHVYPALAVAAAIADADTALAAEYQARAAPAASGASWSLVYVGSVGGMEERIVAAESRLPFRALPAAAVRGRGPLQLARGAAVTLAGIRAARRLIDELRPRAILGTGGYVCVPLFLAARLAGVPTMVYLPDVVPGLAVRFLSRIATLTAVNVEDAARYLRLPVYDVRWEDRSATQQNVKLPDVGRQLIVTGYPVRAELFGQDRAACRRAFGLASELPVVLVYGGSRGARSLNRAIEVLLPDLLAHCQVVHVCGREGDEVWLQAAAARLPTALQGRYRLFPYLESGAGPPGAGGGARGDGDRAEGASSPPLPAPGGASMVAAFGAADLAVCRSGASTLAELPAAGLPAVLVPYPYVHQDENADYLVRRGAAVKVADEAMLGSGRPGDGPLFQQVIRLIQDEHERQRMAERSRALARPDAARHLAQALLSLAARSGG